MTSQKLTISISPDAVITFIYTDLLADLLTEGKAEIRRVSNVEPCEGGWSASMEDGTVLGPYRLRQEALGAEIAYIERNLLHGSRLHSND